MKARPTINKVRFTCNNGVICLKTRGGKLADIKQKRPVTYAE